MKILTLLIAMTLFASFSPIFAEEHEHGKKDDHPLPTSYAEAMKALDEHTGHIAKLMESGKLDDVHHEAANIQKIAQSLAKLASKDGSGVAQDHIRDVNLTSKKLAATFEPIDAAADAGKKDETQKVYDEIVSLIDTLKKLSTK